MAQGDLITAARYNNLQARISTVLGAGSNQEGYGQELRSSEVLPLNTVTAQDMGNLYIDMVKARVHQIGTIPNTISQISKGDTIQDDDVAPYENNSFRAFEELMIDIEADKFQIAETQATIETGLTNSRSTAWNATIAHEFTATFTGYTLPNGVRVSPDDHIRHFFNAGGEIRISSNISGGSGTKTIDWRNILVNAGTIRFNYTQTTSTGSGSGTLFGYYELGLSNEQVFKKQGAYYAYGDNNHTVYARRSGSAEVFFRVEYNDFDSPGGLGIDENVTGTISNTVQSFRPSGNYVSVPGPLYNTIGDLSG